MHELNSPNTVNIFGVGLKLRAHWRDSQRPESYNRLLAYVYSPLADSVLFISSKHKFKQFWGVHYRADTWPSLHVAGAFFTANMSHTGRGTGSNIDVNFLYVLVIHFTTCTFSQGGDYYEIVLKISFSYCVDLHHFQSEMFNALSQLDVF